MPEKETIVTIIFCMVVNIDLWPVLKPANYMSVVMMVIIIFIVPVCMRIVKSVVISPTVIIPSEGFPVSVPMIVFVPVKIFVEMIIATVVAS